MIITPSTGMSAMEAAFNSKATEFNSHMSDTNSVSASAGNGSSFASMLENAINGVKDMETASNQSAYDVAMGNTDDIQNAMILSAKAESAINLTTQITSRAVNSYKEIMQMQL